MSGEEELEKTLVATPPGSPPHSPVLTFKPTGSILDQLEKQESGGIQLDALENQEMMALLNNEPIPEEKEQLEHDLIVAGELQETLVRGGSPQPQGKIVLPSAPIDSFPDPSGGDPFHVSMNPYHDEEHKEHDTELVRREVSLEEALVEEDPWAAVSWEQKYSPDRNYMGAGSEPVYGTSVSDNVVQQYMYDEAKSGLVYGNNPESDQKMKELADYKRDIGSFIRDSQKLAVSRPIPDNRALWDKVKKVVNKEMKGRPEGEVLDEIYNRYQLEGGKNKIDKHNVPLFFDDKKKKAKHISKIDGVIKRLSDDLLRQQHRGDLANVEKMDYISEHLGELSENRKRLSRTQALGDNIRGKFDLADRHKADLIAEAKNSTSPQDWDRTAQIYSQKLDEELDGKPITPMIKGEVSQLGLVRNIMKHDLDGHENSVIAKYPELESRVKRILFNKLSFLKREASKDGYSQQDISGPVRYQNHKALYEDTILQSELERFRADLPTWEDRVRKRDPGVYSELDRYIVHTINPILRRSGPRNIDVKTGKREFFKVKSMGGRGRRGPREVLKDLRALASGRLHEKYTRNIVYKTDKELPNGINAELQKDLRKKQQSHALFNLAAGKKGKFAYRYGNEMGLKKQSKIGAAIVYGVFSNIIEYHLLPGFDNGDISILAGRMSRENGTLYKEIDEETGHLKSLVKITRGSITSNKLREIILTNIDTTLSDNCFVIKKDAMGGGLSDSPFSRMHSHLYNLTSFPHKHSHNLVFGDHKYKYGPKKGKGLIGSLIGQFIPF